MYHIQRSCTFPYHAATTVFTVYNQQPFTAEDSIHEVMVGFYVFLCNSIFKTKTSGMWQYVGCAVSHISRIKVPSKQWEPHPNQSLLEGDSMSDVQFLTSHGSKCLWNNGNDTPIKVFWNATVCRMGSFWHPTDQSAFETWRTTSQSTKWYVSEDMIPQQHWHEHPQMSQQILVYYTLWIYSKVHKLHSLSTTGVPQNLLGNII
jgi:hypothetical protein